MALAPFTGLASQGLRNSFKGKKCEQIVKTHLQKQGWTILAQNTRFYGVEIDLIAQKNKSYILVEVKSLSSEFYLENILSHSQKERLKKVHTLLSLELLPHSLALFLATLNSKKEISFYRISE